MGTQIKFRLREPQLKITPSKQKETPIYMHISFGYYVPAKNAKGKTYMPLTYPTNENIKPYLWGNNRPISSRKIDLSNLITRLDNLENEAREAILSLKNENIELTPATVKNRIDERLGKLEKKQVIHLNQFINQFIDGIESGEILNGKGKRHTGNTIRNIKGLRNQFEYFQNSMGKKYQYQDINIDFYHDFVKYFNQKDYSLNTVGKYIGWFKHILNLAKEKGYHTNDQYNQRAFKKPSQKTYEIYLNESEIKRLEGLSLNGISEKVRDLFLVGCYTALRFSDYSKLKKSNIKQLESGLQVVEAIQQKTGDKVIIPIKSELETIFKKYDYNLPKLTDKTLNKEIKQLGMMAQISGLVEVKEQKNGFQVSKEINKYSKISSHTARRSAITNMYLSGLKPVDIMKISGHKTEREFMKYLKLGLEETAEKLSKTKYFSNNQLKIAK